MNSLQNADMFFFLSSIGFVILFILASILLFYIIKATRSFATLIEKIEENVDSVGDAGMELIEDMRQSVAFRFLFGSKRKK